LSSKPPTTLGFICTVLVSCLLSQPLCAGSDAGNLAITKAWSRATPGGAKVAGGYLTIENRGSAPDRLLSGSTGLARSIEVHEMVVSNGVMTMRPIDGGLTIEPGETVKFAPGGRHLMFLGLKGSLKRGEHIPVKLTFEHAGEIEVSFEVQGLGARAPVREVNSTTAERREGSITSDPDESFFTHLHAEKAMANVTVSPGRAGLVEIEIQLENADEQPLTAKAVSVTLGNSEKGFEPVTTDAEQISNDQWRARMSAPVSGRWSLGLGITISASDKINVVSPILIR
jgi:copper(I)-binding protein